MPDATKRPVSKWRNTEWLQHLQRQAQRLTACPYSADDLAHTCPLAFHDHHRCYPWQHPEPAHALRWCCQKLRALACDAHRHAQRHPCLALEMMPENFACVEIAAQVQANIDGERFVASLPPCLRTAVELRLAGYSWDEAAQQLGVSASTLRGYLPDLGAKFVEFFGYDPSKRASESLIRAEGKTAPSDDRGGDTDEGNTRIGDDTEHAGGGGSLLTPTLSQPFHYSPIRNWRCDLPSTASLPAIVPPATTVTNGASNASAKPSAQCYVPTRKSLPLCYQLWAWTRKMVS